MSNNIPASQVILALADMASKGKYDNVTPQQARNMNALFDAVAEVINWLETEENNALEQAQQDTAVALIDEGEDNE